MISNPFVSVIIPNYNHARYLDKRLQSVLNQTYQNFEVIILDDKSTDNSLEVIDKYRNDSHVREVVVNETNSGSTFKQWNKGIHLAKGELVWIAESDDYCKPTMLEKLVSMFGKYANLSLAFCEMAFVDEDDNINGQSGFSTGGIEMMPGKTFIKKYEMQGNNIRNASAVLFSRARTLSVDQSFVNFKAAGDYFFWCQMMADGNVAFVDEVLNYCRVDGKNVTSKAMTSGLSFKEDYQVHGYFRKMGYIGSLYEELNIRHHYLDWIRYSEFDTETIKRDIVNLWSTFGFIRPGAFRYWYRMVKKIHAVLTSVK